MRIFWVMAVAVCLAGTARAAPDYAQIDDLVAANKVLADLGVVDGFGHISVRSERNPNHYLMSRSIAPALVHDADILEYDLDSNPIDARGQALFLERFIHGEIYKARPDVKAIIHDHSPTLIPFGATTVKLQPIYHMSSFLGPGVPVFEIRDVAPASDMLVRTPAIGAALAKVLADKPMALMRGHGAVVVGNSIPQVVFRAYYAEMNARLQAEALRLGPVTFLSDEEAAAAAKTNDGVLERTWEAWKRQAKTR
jgi:HCOMODA/2-hydroxy-3-carboxy-muconic semialdehyde decarboxylase